jgi:serine/threonine-protein kinase RsbW
MAERANVFLRLSNSAENIVLVRQALSGVAEHMDLPAGAVNDIRTAATEACNNVAVHAYAGAEGPLEVEIGCHADALAVVVRDHGTGIRPRIRSQSDSALGIGLAIIQALARRVEFNDPSGGGTEVRMEFGASLAQGPLARAGLSRPPERADDGAELASTTVLAIAPSLLASNVLPRVLTVLAARAGFTTDRISDVQLIADALAAQARDASGSDELRLTARTARRRVELAVGPLADGTARELVERSRGEGTASLIGKLSDEHRIDDTPGARSSTLILALADRV